MGCVNVTCCCILNISINRQCTVWLCRSAQWMLYWYCVSLIVMLQ